MLWTTKKSIAGKLWQLHQAEAKDNDNHTAIAYCPCRTSQLYRIVAAEYRLQRDTEGKGVL